MELIEQRAITLIRRFLPVSLLGQPALALVGMVPHLMVTKEALAPGAQKFEVGSALDQDVEFQAWSTARKCWLYQIEPRGRPSLTNSLTP